MSRPRWKSVLIVSSLALLALVLLAQLVPYGRAHTNPPVAAEPRWDSPATRALAQRACFDCHSNETSWPWYSHVAPASWLVQNHVDEGRRVLNFSEWGRPQDEADEAAQEVREGEMPPRSYLILHPEARLTAAERDQLVRGLDATFGGRDEVSAASR
ncbi:MAG: heme-binding domain-containing protein [Myxococcales bacterium]|nr:heme-binding domain-containing protein [Myxococcales bacterium]